MKILSNTYKVFLTGVLFVCSISFCRSQPVIDAKLSLKYQAAVKKMPAEYKALFSDKSIATFGGKESENNGPIGFGILSYYKIDTLNISDLIQYKKSKITVSGVDSDSSSENITEMEPELSLHPFFPNIMVTATLKKDTLIIRWSELEGASIISKITKNSTTSKYSDYQRHDNVFRANLIDPKTSEISLPATTVSFKISSKNWNEGNIIYGETEIVSDPYYYDDFSFKNGFIKKRIHYKYIFKLKIQDLQKYDPINK